MRTKVRLVIELDNIDLGSPAIRKDLDKWISALTEDVEKDLLNGEIISTSFWLREVKDDFGNFKAWSPGR